MDDIASLSGLPFRGLSRPSRKFRAGRVCADPDCQTRLSIYNSGKHCALHAPMVVPRTRGRRTEDAR